MSVQPPLIRPSDNQISLADFDAIKVIGKGNGGIVRLVQHKWTSQFFALKMKQYISSRKRILIHDLTTMPALQKKSTVNERELKVYCSILVSWSSDLLNIQISVISHWFHYQAFYSRVCLKADCPGIEN
ncbi:hypothetical protein HYC85_010937 [Camellia sinensis]|uniref:Protein kinase domain-containing protein n=1 Tax=Camellia sinensis TaxID=4442 RepID=A0A7J7HJG3_CAMSI|nr:hypothetical protein HYC85_010937 [Camellia sinensis]